MKVYLVYDEYSHNDGYAMNHGVFATSKLAEDWVENTSEFDNYSDGEERRANCEIEEFELIKETK